MNLTARVIRLEDEQTKSDEARTVPLPSVLAEILSKVEDKHGRVFDDTNLRVEWEKACASVGLGTRTKVEPKTEDGFTWYKYKGLIVHELRRSAVRNLRQAGVSESVIMRISGHKTAEVFRRYNIVSTDDVTAAMPLVETASLPTDGANLVQGDRHPTKRLSASNPKRRAGA